MWVLGLVCGTILVGVSGTLATRRVCYFSRSRGALWRKGETSGQVQHLKEMRVDCDQDALLLRVQALGPGVCHNGYQSCFYRRLESGEWIASEPPAFDPAAVYGSQS